MTLRPWCSPVRTTARIAAFIPGASPPEVRTPIAWSGGKEVGADQHAATSDSVTAAPRPVQRPETRTLVKEPVCFRALLQNGLEHRDVHEIQDRPAVAADVAVHPRLERKPVRPGDRLVAAAGAARGERNVSTHRFAPC